MPLQRTSLITRKQLSCISGGIVENVRCKNYLNLGTPFNFYGGKSFATKGMYVHHICVKEEMNTPFPDSNTETLIIHKYDTKKDGSTPREIELMKKRVHIIPIFLEPEDQSNKSGKDSGAGITYVGHWKVKRVKLKNYIWRGQKICAKVYFDFDRFDEHFSRWIEMAHDKTCSHLLMKTIKLRKIVKSKNGCQSDRDKVNNAKCTNTVSGINKRTTKRTLKISDDEEDSVEVVTCDSKKIKVEDESNTENEYELFTIKMAESTNARNSFVTALKSPNIMFLDIRHAINSQLELDPKFHVYTFCVSGLDFSHRQETNKVKDFIKNGSGTVDDPFDGIIIKSCNV